MDKKSPLKKSFYGGTLRWGTSNPPTIINPILTTHSVSASLLGLLFNSLVRINEKGEIEADLAKSWEISEDKLTYTFYLNPGILFHDGTECTAKDILFTYQQLLNQNLNSPKKYLYENIKKFEAPSKHIFKVKLSKPQPTIMLILNRGILPKHLLEKEDIKVSSFNFSPIGTGPFKFSGWDKKKSEIQLKANLEYYEGRPFLDRIIIKSYPDIKKLWSALMRQEIDFANFISKEDFTIIKDDPKFKTYQVIGNVYFALSYNLKDPILSNKVIRKAIAHSINVQKIIDQVYNGSGIRSVGHFHPETDGFNHKVSPLKYDPHKAYMDLLSQGWSDRNKDSILERGKRNLELNILVDQKNTVYRQIAALIRQDLYAIGIKVNLILYKDKSDFSADFLDQTKAQAWLRMFHGYSPTKIDSEYAASYYWYSKHNDSTNIWEYKNEKLDALFEFCEKSDNLTERINAYKQMHKIIYEDQPVCFLFYPVGYGAISSKFINTDEHFSVQMPVYTMKNWMIASALNN